MNKRHMVMSCWGLILKSLDVSGDGWVSGCGSGYVGGIFCGEIEFQGRVLTGWWVGVGDGFCISGFTFLRCLVGVFGV